MEILNLFGKNFEAYKIDLFGSNLMIIKGSKGFLACGYISIETAEKLSAAAAIVKGVKNFEDMKNAKVVALTSKAKELDCKEGMSGAQALEIFA